MGKLKAGIVGTNFISDWFCESCLDSRAVLPVAVCSRDRERGRAFALKYGIENVFCDYGEMLLSDIDLVYIANPNSLHMPYSLDALRHGKHVLCEKPAALDRDSLTEAVAEAEKRGLVFMEAMRTVHDPIAFAIKDLISREGPVKEAHLSFRQYSSRYDSFKEGIILNAFNPALGNAAVMDIGIYPISLCVFLFGVPLEIKSSSEKLSNGFEGSGEALFRYPDLNVLISYSKIAAQEAPSHIDLGSKRITIGKISTMEQVLAGEIGGTAEEILAERPRNNMVYEIMDFEKCVNDPSAAARWNEYSIQAISCVDRIRKQNGIFFEE